MNGSVYHIPQTTAENEFEVWMDNRVTFNDLAFIMSATSHPPSSMTIHVMYIPKDVSVFINVMHYVNWTELTYNVTDLDGKIVGTAQKLDFFNKNSYFGIFTFIFLSRLEN